MLLNARIPPAYIIRKVRLQMVITCLIAVAVNLIVHYCGARIPEMPLSVPAFIGTAISILLSFKLNQSYDRWWEARKVWGSIVNDSRTLVMQVQAFLPGDLELLRRIAYRQIAFCYALGNSLRGQDALTETGELLQPGDLELINRHHNKALAILQLNTLEIAGQRMAGKLETLSHLQIDNTFTRLCDSMGRAERIKSTIFPVTYSRFLHLSIYLFVVTLAVALGGINWMFEIPLLVVIAAAFFLLERSAVNLQDPFSNRPTDTAVTAIARTIEINIRQLVGEKEVPPPALPQGYYLM
jgi:putative membrane protein